MRKRKGPRFKVGQVVFDAERLAYGLLFGRVIKGIWTIVCTRGITMRDEYQVAETDLRPLTKRERGDS